MLALNNLRVVVYGKTRRFLRVSAISTTDGIDAPVS
jgi:hypothetical protein